MSDILKSPKPGSLLRASKPLPWMAWAVGVAACVALVLVVTQRTEEEEFLRLIEKIEPSWLGLAVVLQVGTYVTQGLVWRIAARMGRRLLPIRKLLELSLATLFVDQTLPTGGLSGVAMASGGLLRIGMPRPVVASAVLVDLAMYALAYAFCVALATGVAMFRGYLPGWVMLGMLQFVLIELGSACFVIALPGGGMKALRKKLHRMKTTARLLDFLEDAPRDSFRDRRLLRRAFMLHVATFFLDVVTLWVCVLALGGRAPIGGLFASFMASTFFRTIGIMPGGLGTFEAASVLSLKSVGVPLPVGLSATLLFRGLSFWLPMIPGLICSRRLLGKREVDVSDA